MESSQASSATFNTEYSTSNGHHHHNSTAETWSHGPPDLRRQSTGPSADPRLLSRVESQVKSTLQSHGAPEKRQVWTFSSSGWLFVYFFGVIKVLRDLKLNENIHVVGSSGGACAGSYLFLPEADIDATVEYIKQCAVKARSSLSNALKISEYVQGAIERFQPADAHKRVQGNMEISVSHLQNPLTSWPPLPLKNKRIKHFATNKEMEAAIIASARIVPSPINLRGIGPCIDGVYSDSQLVSPLLFGRSFFTLHVEDAISVCPFYSSRADIVPSKFVNPTWAAYPPPPEKLGELYELGYRDALAWLLKNGKIPFGIATPGSSSEDDTADSQVPAWRHKLSDVLASVQAQMSEGAEILRDSAQAAVGCDAAASELVTDAVSGMQSAVSLLAWMLIVWEMFVHSCIAAAVTACSPILPVTTAESWKRFTSVSRSMASPRLFLKMVPALSPHVDLKKNREFADNLKQHSILYRVLQHVVI